MQCMHTYCTGTNKDEYSLSQHTHFSICGPLSPADVHICEFDAEGEVSRELVQGVEENLVPREGQDSGSPAARDEVVVRILPGPDWPNGALQPRVVREQPVDELVRADILRRTRKKGGQTEALHNGSLRE